MGSNSRWLWRHSTPYYVIRSAKQKSMPRLATLGNVVHRLSWTDRYGGRWRMKCACGWTDPSIHGSKREATNVANRHVKQVINAANPEEVKTKRILLGLIVIAVVLWVGISYLVSPHSWKMPSVVGLTLGKAEGRLKSINYNLMWATGSTGTAGNVSGTSPDIWINSDWTVCSQSPKPGVKTASARLYLAHTGYGEKCLSNGHATDPTN